MARAHRGEQSDRTLAHRADGLPVVLGRLAPEVVVEGVGQGVDRLLLRVLLVLEAAESRPLRLGQPLVVRVDRVGVRRRPDRVPDRAAVDEGDVVVQNRVVAPDGRGHADSRCSAAWTRPAPRMCRAGHRARKRRRGQRPAPLMARQPPTADPCRPILPAQAGELSPAPAVGRSQPLEVAARPPSARPRRPFRRLRLLPAPADAAP